VPKGWGRLAGFIGLFNPDLKGTNGILEGSMKNLGETRDLKKMD